MNDETTTGGTQATAIPTQKSCVHINQVESTPLVTSTVIFAQWIWW